MLDQYPPLRDELPALLRSIDGGEAADVSGLADGGVRGALEALFGALRLARGAEGWYRQTGGVAAYETLKGVIGGDEGKARCQAKKKDFT